MPIEQHSPELERLVDVRQEIEELARGFGGAAGPAEGRCGGRKEAISCSVTLGIIGG